MKHHYTKTDEWKHNWGVEPEATRSIFEALQKGLDALTAQWQAEAITWDELQKKEKELLDIFEKDYEAKLRELDKESTSSVDDNTTESKTK